jgi:hypothetical protein
MPPHEATDTVSRLMRGHAQVLIAGIFLALLELGEGPFDVLWRRFESAIVADADTGHSAAHGVEVVAAERRARSGHEPLAGPADCILQRLVGQFEAHLLVVDLNDLLAILIVGIGDFQMELEAAGTQQGRVKDLDEVGRADDEDQFFLAEAVHLRQQLVDHRVLDAGAGVGAASAGERVQFIEDDDGRRRLPGLVEDLAQIIFTFADPFTL